MLLNPFSTLLRVIPGSRVLEDALGLGVIGLTIEDRSKPGRIWAVTNLYAPIESRKLTGIRAKLEDQKGFVSFCNQRDLELFLGLGQPGHPCFWLDEDYPEMDSPEFYGLCADWEDLRDDLYERELQLRMQSMEAVLPFGLELTRRVHMSSGIDVEELQMMLYDADPESGWGPDPRLETLDARWSRVERRKVQWERLAA